jgi:hypothetical protein
MMDVSIERGHKASNGCDCSAEKEIITLPESYSQIEQLSSESCSTMVWQTQPASHTKATTPQAVDALQTLTTNESAETPKQSGDSVNMMELTISRSGEALTISNDDLSKSTGNPADGRSQSIS